MATADIDEKQLVEQAKYDPEAFGRLYELYVDRIYSYIFHRTGNQHDAEDLTAKVFHRVLKNIQRYDDKGVPFSAWLFRIAHNLVANWYRDHARRPTVNLEKLNLSADHRHNPHRAAEETNKLELLQAALRQLPPERQDLITLKFVERMSNAEIGQIMGRTENAIKSLYHRTVISLREILADHRNLVQPSIEED
jgi:RNA polymerase sigma-70 factor (ECF subfamily)